MIDFSVSLPQVWMTRLEGADWFRAAPLLVEGRVLARTGNAVVAFDSGSGELLWRRELGERAGEWMVPAPGGAIADLRQGPDRTTVLVGLAAAGGEPLWRRPLGCMVPRDGVTIGGESLIAVGLDAAGRRTLVVVDRRTGAVSAEHALPLGGARAVEVSGGYVIARPSVDQGPDAAPGLYLLGEDGEVQVIDERPTWNVARIDDTLLSVRRVDGGATEVIARRTSDFEISWTAGSQGEELGVGAAEVALIDPSSGALVPVLRDAATGSERWRGVPLGAKAAFRGVAGPLVYFRGSDDIWLYRLRDGSLVGAGEGDFSFGVAASDDRVYLGVEDALLCVELPA